MHYEKLGRRIKLLMPKYRTDPVSRLEDIPEKVYSTKLKPIVVVPQLFVLVIIAQKFALSFFQLFKFNVTNIYCEEEFFLSQRNIFLSCVNREA